MKIYFELFFTFFKLGLFTFGGGYAMLPLLEKEVSEKKKWATREELLDYYAIGQVTPGIIAVNVATFIGTKTKGLVGAFFSTFGLVAPSIIIIVAIASVLGNFMENPYLVHTFNGIRLGVSVLIFNSLIGMAKKAIIDKLGFVLFTAALVLTLFTDLSAVYFVLAAILAGVISKRGKAS